MNKINLGLYEDTDRLRFVQRWSGKMVIDRLNVLEHTARVSVLCRILMDNLIVSGKPLPIEVRSHVYEYSQVHDLEEAYTGDVPHSAKSDFPELKKELKAVSELLIGKYWSCSDDVGMKTLVTTIVKCADCIDCTREATNEIEVGNTKFDMMLVRSRLTSVLVGMRATMLVDCKNLNDIGSAKRFDLGADQFGHEKAVEKLANLEFAVECINISIKLMESV